MSDPIAPSLRPAALSAPSAIGRYVVIGAGAVGATVGAQLHQAGHRVVLVARGAHLETLRTHGLTYIRPEGRRLLDIPVVAGPSELTLEPDDVLVLATKSQDTESVLAEWGWQPVAQSEPTGLQAVDRAFYLGRAPLGEHDAARRVADDLRGAGFAVQVVVDIERWKAEKLVGNIGHNLDALYAPGPLRDRASAALRAAAGAARRGRPARTARARGPGRERRADRSLLMTENPSGAPTACDHTPTDRKRP
jgi:thiosulfate/3-mercaptopyruvate sulfurtransferase